MQNFSRELWDIIELARSKDLHPLYIGYLKSAFGNIYEKYLYDDNLTYLKFLDILEEDIKSEKLKINNFAPG